MRTFQAWNRDLHKYPPVIWDSENDENGPFIDDGLFQMTMFKSYVNLLEGMFFFFVGEFPDLFLVVPSEYSSCWLTSIRLDAPQYLDVEDDGFLWLVIGKEVQLPMTDPWCCHIW